MLSCSNEFMLGLGAALQQPEHPWARRSSTLVGLVYFLVFSPVWIYYSLAACYHCYVRYTTTHATELDTTRHSVSIYVYTWSMKKGDQKARIILVQWSRRWKANTRQELVSALTDTIQTILLLIVSLCHFLLLSGVYNILSFSVSHFLVLSGCVGVVVTVGTLLCVCG